MNKIEKKILTSEFIKKKKISIKEDVDSIFVGGKEDMINFFSHYVYWNGVFAGCVTNLASNFHLFVNKPGFSGKTPPPEDIMTFFKQKGHKVAGLIFAAAEDEYADDSAVVSDLRVCHKDMAWHFLKELYTYYNKDIKKRKIEFFAEEINNAIMRGYRVDRGALCSDLYRGLGFHIGSEKIASFEFDYLTKKMNKEYPELVKFLKNKELVPGINAFSWLEVHSSVEEEHFGYALEAANIIIDYFDKKDLQRNPFQFIKEGFVEFSNLQNIFFDHYSGIEEVKVI